MNRNICHILFLSAILFAVPCEQVAQPLTTDALPLKIGANFRLHPGNVNQTEVFIVQSPLDDNLLFSSCNTLSFIPFFISEGIYISHDGGYSWKGSDTCSGKPIEFHGGDPGITIDRNGTFILTRLGRAPFVGLFSHYSTDQGLSWSSQKAISTDDLERASLTSDNDPSSPYYGRSYAAWVKFAYPYPLMFAYTDNGAQSWSNPAPVNNPPQRSAGGDMDIGPDGEVYACWAGVTSVSPFREIHVGFAVSTTGGTSWNVTENAFAVNGITGILREKDSIRVNGLPSIAVDTTNGPRKGWIYIVTGQKNLAPAGSDPDIILNRSTDGGKTWTPGIRVNQDPVNNGKIQYFPAIHVDQYGGIDIIYYDDRFTSSDSSGVMLARSLDGGNTWHEYLISDRNFKPRTIGGLGQGYQGDNIDLTSTGERILPVWMDNRTGVYQIWTVPVSFSDVSSEQEPLSELYFNLFQNQPNPFTDQTTITIQMKKPARFSLSIYDITGHPVTTLSGEGRNPGIFRFTIRKEGEGYTLRPGLYFYQLMVDGQISTRKMVVTE